MIVFNTLELLFLKVVYILLNILGATNIYQKYGVCWFSKHFFDVHDFYKSKGGNGTPMSMYTYKCSKCNKEFSI